MDAVAVFFREGSHEKGKPDFGPDVPTICLKHINPITKALRQVRFLALLELHKSGAPCEKNELAATLMAIEQATPEFKSISFNLKPRCALRS